MPEDPFRFALELICASPHRAAEAAALAAPGAVARARRIRSCLRAFARDANDVEHDVLVRGPGLAAPSGAVRFDAHGVRRAARRSLLTCEPALLLPVEPDAARALARLCTFMGLDANVELDAARTSNDVFVAFGKRGGRAVVAHLGCDPSVHAPLENHARVLAELRDGAAELGIDGLVAEPLGFEIKDGAALLLQTRLPGAAPEWARLDEGELDLHLRLALEPLVRVHASGASVPDGPDAERVNARFPRLVEALPAHRDALRPAIEHLLRWLARRELPAVRVHGDYWLGNLLFEPAAHGPPRLTGIVDWDRSRARGLPGLDALHLAVASVAEWLGSSMGEVLAGVWDPRRRHALLALHLERVERALALDRATLEHLALALWLGYLDDACAETDRPDARWTALAIAAPAAAIRGWLGRGGADEGARA